MGPNKLSLNSLWHTEYILTNGLVLYIRFTTNSYGLSTTCIRLLFHRLQIIQISSMTHLNGFPEGQGETYRVHSYERAGTVYTFYNKSVRTFHFVYKIVVS